MKRFVIFHFIDHVFILCIPEVTEFLGIRIRFVSLGLRELTGKPDRLQSPAFVILFYPVDKEE